MYTNTVQLFVSSLCSNLHVIGVDLLKQQSLTETESHSVSVRGYVLCNIINKLFKLGL